MQCFSSEKVFIGHKDICVKINGEQSVKLRDDSIKFKNYSKQLAVPFKIYADFESVLKRVPKDRSSNSSYTKKYQEPVPCSFAYKAVCIDDRFSKSVVLYKGKKYAVNKFIKATRK